MDNTTLEQHVNHPNFKRLEEKKDRFIVYMHSVKMKQGEETIYFNIDKSARVSTKTYSIVIQKKIHYQTSRIG